MHKAPPDTRAGFPLARDEKPLSIRRRYLMSRTPDVSVVIPTCDRPALVTRAVQSALNQSVTTIEVIVVVDGADAGTLAALAALRDPRLHVLPLTERAGAPNARNVGVAAARAEWTAFLDDDDEWLPHKLEVQLRLARTATVPAPIVASRLVNRTPRAEFVLPRRLPEPDEPICEYLTVRRGLFHGDGFIQTSTILASTALLRRVPFTVGLRRQQELDWTLRALAHDDVRLVMATEPLVLWHQDEDRPRISLSSPWKAQLDWLRSIRTLVTPRAYAAIALSIIGSMAATTRDPHVFRTVLADARRHGRPGLLDYLTYLQIWLIPPQLRHTLRDHILARRRVSAPAQTPAADTAPRPAEPNRTGAAASQNP
ncbi:glycosyltransferase family 2 protein [Salinispora tropica]|uniref:Glycosyl transferase, family 2 n=1 Tax=Salinispora tropica (strain ATCC BAA-916 / DSM 44818 / JCM 13857 / NBRC 105044 / CNB-440) TaxID=369723 RepID=A4X6N0_SALTO|nr:glycosyl transferase, family 2 [Salinispora tropica CNB-440]